MARNLWKLQLWLITKGGCDEEEKDVTIEAITKEERDADSKYPLAVKRDGKYNFVNADGEYISEVWFDWAREFNKGLAMVYLDKKYNFIDEHGDYLLETWCFKAYSFTGGFARIKLKPRGKYNYINRNGEYLSATWYDDAWYFCGGFARVRLGKKWNFVDTKGCYLSGVWFDEVWSFSDGFARVEADRKWSFIGKGGGLLSNTWFDKVFAFRGGVACVTLNGRLNYINAAGEYVSDTWFDGGDSRFVGEYAYVMLNGRVNGINKEGEFLSDEWLDGLYCHITENAGCLVYCNGIDNGGFTTARKGDRFNLIRDGRLLTDTWFESMLFFRDGIAKVRLEGKYNFIDTDGSFISSVWYDAVNGYTEDGHIRVRLGKRYLKINRQGKRVK